MKKLISLLTAGLVAAFSATAGPNYYNASFLNNCQWLVIPTNTTVNFSDTNVGYEVPIGPYGWTNVLSLTTNLNGNIIGQWEKDLSPLLCDANGNVSTNWMVVIEWQSTNLNLSTKSTPSANYPNAPLPWYNTNGTFIYGNVTNMFTNSYGIVSSNISYYYPLPPITPNATSTNALTLTFVKELVPGVFGTLADSQYSLTVTNVGAGVTCLSSFLPASFTAGANKIRLTKIVSGTAVGTSAGSLVNDIRLVGYQP